MTLHLRIPRGGLPLLALLLATPLAGTGLWRGRGGAGPVAAAPSASASRHAGLPPGPLASLSPEAEAEVRATVGEVIAAASHPSLRWPRFASYRDAMETLYGPAGNAPVWFDGTRPRSQVQDVIGVLREADTRGLPPEDYEPELLTRWERAALEGHGLAPREIGLFDTALSLLYMRHLSDVHIGRVDPRRLNIDFDIESKKYALSDRVRMALDENRVRETVEEREPGFQQYQGLKQALQHYRRLASGVALTPLPVVRKLSPGDLYEGTPHLAGLLAAFGDLAGGAAPVSPVPSPAALYEGELVEAVKRFQARHGLNPDGIVGASTFARLNVPPEQRVRQIELSLERFRWLSELPPGPVIAVNIPAFRLWCFDLPAREGQPSLQMKVVVGKALKTETPVFGEQMQYLVFRPYWNVPYSIAVKETLPAIEREPGYLEANDMELVDGQGDEAPVVAPTPESLAKVRGGACRIRQRPGPRNALGLVAFMFPNNVNVYMHSTPAPSLFARDRRDLSHGCIRVADAVGLAEWVLRGLPEWDRPRVEKAMAATGPPERLNLPRPIPVLILYTTAATDRQGRVAFFEDIYEHDRRLEAALREGEPDAP